MGHKHEERGSRDVEPIPASLAFPVGPGEEVGIIKDSRRLRVSCCLTLEGQIQREPAP
jgi:hypothetical protein